MFNEVLGWELEAAVSVIKEAGYSPEVITTTAPRKKTVGKPRVARIREIEPRIVELLVVFNDEAGIDTGCPWVRLSAGTSDD
ncbi:MAG: hypothetical protein AB1510_08780 [Bacillota bacterium]